MLDTVNAWLAVVGGIGGVLSALIVWGFASGRFIQKRTDEFDSLERRHSALADRVTKNDASIEEITRSLHALREETNRDFGKMQLMQELLQQRVDHHKEQATDRREQVDARLKRLEAREIERRTT